MHEDGGVFPGRRLQAQLGVRRLGVVGEGDGAGQLAIVQHLLVVLGQVDVTLRLELESALQRCGRNKEEEEEEEEDKEEKVRGGKTEEKKHKIQQNESSGNKGVFIVCVSVCPARHSKWGTA